MYKRFNYDNGELMAVYKKTKEGIIAVYNDSISIYVYSWEQLPEEEGYKRTTKKVFQKMFNQTMERIKKANS